MEASKASPTRPVCMDAPLSRPEPAPQAPPRPDLTPMHQAIVLACPNSPPRPRGDEEEGWQLEIVASRQGERLVQWLPTRYAHKHEADHAAFVYAKDLKAIFYDVQEECWVLEWQPAWIKDDAFEGIPLSDEED